MASAGGRPPRNEARSRRRGASDKEAAAQTKSTPVDDHVDGGPRRPRPDHQAARCRGGGGRKLAGAGRAGICAEGEGGVKVGVVNTRWSRQSASSGTHMIKTLHPFPARMAPGLALDGLIGLKRGSVVLDPMTGSGMVLRQAIDLGHRAIGFDLDPLAVLMAGVWTTPIDNHRATELAAQVVELAASTSSAWTRLPWLDEDVETRKFVDYWFASEQRRELRRLVQALLTVESKLESEGDRAIANLLRLSVSRIIVTKEQAASLARDTSHSRPHRVATTSSYNVLKGFERSVGAVLTRLRESPPKGIAQVSQGDARCLDRIENDSVDAIVTSPPYLNAIDYLRGHRMSLVWLGWSVPALRQIRSISIGSERGPDVPGESSSDVAEAMLGNAQIDGRHARMISRYAEDLSSTLGEVARVLKPTGQATFVVGNSCLKGVFIKNDEGVAAAARQYGLTEISRHVRELPQRSRYLPVTGAALAKRMRTETVLTFATA